MDNREKEQTELDKLIIKLKIDEKDIKEVFVRSSKPGGQNVNKVSTCVQLTHVPTGIQVKCEETRSQALNRFKAKYLLVKKIEKSILDEKVRKKQEREKKRRQARKRPRRVKEEILKEKLIQSEKKSRRKRISPGRTDYD